MNGKHLTFDVECVWRRNMVIRDRETGTLWQHATGEALAGPLQGAHLQLLGGELCTWAAWKQTHPQTLAALEPEEWTGLASKDKTNALLEKATRIKVVPGLTKQDDRLPAFESVAGLTINGSARAYPLASLRHLGTLTEQLAGKEVRLTYDPDKDQISAFVDESPSFVQRTWWTGWYEFHPQTTIFKPEAGNEKD